MRKLLLIVTLFLSGCATLQPNESYERLLNRSRKPITVVSVTREVGVTSVLFRDARGKYFTIVGPQFGTLTPGTVLY